MSILDYESFDSDRKARIGRDDPLGLIWWLAAMAALVWVVVPVLYITAAHGADAIARANATTPPDAFSPRDMVIIVISGSGGGLLTLLAGSRFLWPRAFDRLGISSRRLPPGIVKGLFASLIVLPLMFGVMLGTDWLWNRIHFQHPNEHDLLQILGQTTSPPMKLAIIASAIFLAPLFEELLFRGYLQSALLATILRWRGHLDERWTATGPRWAAIVISSIAFTLVHQHLWLMPPIFFLSICLGYAYERTNNLWVTIFVHAAFNGVSTLVFLITR